MTIDINCDLGEHYKNSLADIDEAIMPYISSANIACGFHAGDPLTMRATIRLCKKYGVAAGAHPSFFDPKGFGRRNMECSTDEIFAFTVYQVGAMKALCDAEGLALHHVKPHGALYNMSAHRPEWVAAIIEAIRQVDDHLILYGLSGSAHEQVADELQHPFAAEVFADRAYSAEGHLIPRSEPGAVYDEQTKSIEQGTLLAKQHQVCAKTGKIITLRADTLCLHGDQPGAELLAKHLYERLTDEGVMIRKVQR